MPRTTSLCRTMRSGRIPFRSGKTNRFSSKFRSPTTFHAQDLNGLSLILSAGTQAGDIIDHEAIKDIIGDYDFRNRVYSPSLGRWLSNDPIGFRAGDVNAFRYAGKNGIN